MEYPVAPTMSAIASLRVQRWQYFDCRSTGWLLLVHLVHLRRHNLVLPNLDHRHLGSRIPSVFPFWASTGPVDLRIFPWASRGIPTGCPTTATPIRQCIPLSFQNRNVASVAVGSLLEIHFTGESKQSAPGFEWLAEQLSRWGSFAPITSFACCWALVLAF